MTPRKPRLPMPPGNWRPVPGFESLYWVSDQGEIFTQPRMGSSGGLIKLQRAVTGGYLIYRFYDGSRRQTRTIHKVVAEAFLGPAPDGMEVRHINGDPTDCRLANLTYGSHSENVSDTVRHGNHIWANKTHCPSGHPYDRENTRMYDGRRYCRACHRERSRARRLREWEDAA